MGVETAKRAHEVAYQDLCKLMSAHADNVSAIQLLAIAGNMIGKLIALQDQRVVTPALAMETVMRNIDLGNKQVLDMLSQTEGGGGKNG